METAEFIKNKTRGVLELVSEDATRESKLKEMEYFALMVTGGSTSFDEYKKAGYDINTNPLKHTVDVGIECTSEKRYYISKDFNNRNDSYRGRTIIVKVTDLTKCCLLDY